MSVALRPFAFALALLGLAAGSAAAQECPTEARNFLGMAMQETTDTEVTATFEVPEGGGIALVVMGVWGVSDQSGTKRLNVSAFLDQGDRLAEGRSGAQRPGSDETATLCAQTLTMRYYLHTSAGDKVIWGARVEPELIDQHVMYYNLFFLDRAALAAGALDQLSGSQN